MSHLLDWDTWQSQVPSTPTPTSAASPFSLGPTPAVSPTQPAVVGPATAAAAVATSRPTPSHVIEVGEDDDDDDNVEDLALFERKRREELQQDDSVDDRLLRASKRVEDKYGALEDKQASPPPSDTPLLPAKRIGLREGDYAFGRSGDDPFKRRQQQQGQSQGQVEPQSKIDRDLKRAREEKEPPARGKRDDSNTRDSRNQPRRGDSRDRSSGSHRQKEGDFSSSNSSSKRVRPEEEAELTVIQRQMKKMRQICVRAVTEDVQRRVNRNRRDLIDHNRHWSETAVDQMTERDWRIFKEDFQIITKGNAPKPLRSWQESALPPRMLAAIEEAGFKDPSPIQMQTIPIALINRDVIGVAQTGSGKTAAFVIPMCVYISRQPPMTGDAVMDGPYAIVMAPARELAQQIEDETARFCRHMRQKVLCIVGGVSMEEQAQRIRSGMDIIIGTPGRMVDIIERKYLVLNQCNYVVLDEADRMIDMGFEPQVKQVLDFMPSSNLRPENEELEEKDRTYRQTFMFSATMPAAVEKLAVTYMRRPIHVQIGEVGTPIDRIEQRVEWVTSDHQKRSLLIDLLASADPPVIVFCNQREKVENIAKLIESEGHSVTTLRGGKSQDARSEALDVFKKGGFDVLVATDVAARGIDVRNVTHVVNFDMPKTIEFYQHRIGRTGRAGAKGVAVSFLSPQDVDIMYDLTNLLRNCKQIIPKQLSDHDASKAKPGTVEYANKKRKDTVIYSKKTQGI